MRFFILISCFFLSSMASAETYECIGNFDSEGATLYVRNLSSREPVEGFRDNYYVEIKEGEELIFSGNVTGVSYDVALIFEPMPNTQTNFRVGKIYLDELDQTVMKLVGATYYFDCSNNYR